MSEVNYRSIEFRPEFSHPMVAAVTFFIERNSLFPNEKEKLFRDWVNSELASARFANFDEYTLSTMRGQMMRCVFLGMFLEKSIDAKQMCVLSFPKAWRLKNVGEQSEIRKEAEQTFRESKTLSTGEVLGPSISGFPEFLEGAKWVLIYLSKHEGDDYFKQLAKELDS